MEKEYVFPIETEEGYPKDPMDGEFYSLHTVKHPGMTLRDYFAGQALIGKVMKGSYNYGTTSQSCYRIADDMLREREKVT